MTSLGACSINPAAHGAAATSSNFLAAAVKTPFPLLMDYSWLLLRCMDAY
jgi:hypothetical protein